MLGPHDLEDFYTTFDRARGTGRGSVVATHRPEPAVDAPLAAVVMPAPAAPTPLLRRLVAMVRMARNRGFSGAFARG